LDLVAGGAAGELGHVRRRRVAAWMDPDSGEADPAQERWVWLQGGGSNIGAAGGPWWGARGGNTLDSLCDGAPPSPAMDAAAVCRLNDARPDLGPVMRAFLFFLFSLTVAGKGTASINC